MPIIRRNNGIYATLVICHSVWMTGMQRAYQSVTNNKCRIDTVISLLMMGT